MKSKLIFALIFHYIIFWFAFDFLRWDQFDTEGFIASSRYLFGLEGGGNIQSRVSKPLYIILPGFFEYCIGLHPRISFLLLNSIAFFILPLLVYKITFKIQQSSNIAFFSAIAYINCAPFMLYALFIMSDVWGWLMIALSIYLILTKVLNNKNIVYISLLCAIACFIKESAVVGFIFLSFQLIFSASLKWEKAKKIVLALIAFAGSFLIFHSALQNYLGDSIFLRLKHAHNVKEIDLLNINNFKQLYRSIDVFWIPLFITIFYVIKHKGVHEQYIKSSLATVLCGILLCHIWPYSIDRIYFILAIPTFMIISNLWKFIGERSFVILIICCSVLNFISTYLIYSFQIHNLLLVGVGITLFIIFILSAQNLKRNKMNN